MNINEINKKAINLIENYKLIEVIGDVDTIFCAGSLYEGYGNEKSDVDIFILQSKNIEDICIDYHFVGMNNVEVVKKNNVIIISLEEEGMCFDLEIHNIKLVNSYIKKISSLDASVNDIYYDFVHRLKYAMPIYNIENFEYLKETIDYEKYNFLYPLVISTYYPLKVTDVQGAYEANDFTTSLYMAYLLYKDIIQSYLCLNDFTNPGEKWFIKNIETYSRNSEEDLIYENAKVFNMLNFENLENCKKNIIEILYICQKYNSKIQKGIKEIGGVNKYV
ncbi:hypothetical protein NYT34_02890 [Staphylococcus aureus]|nr:hypothetical protein [Staphylococcus aureus]